MKYLYCCLFLFLLQTSVNAQSREVAANAIWIPDGFAGGGVDYFIPVKGRFSAGVKLFYMTDNVNYNLQYDYRPSISKRLETSLVFRRLSSNRLNSRFQYELGFSILHISETYSTYKPTPGILYNPITTINLASPYIAMPFEDYSENYLLMGAASGVKWERRVGAQAFFGIQLDIQVLYDFRDKSWYPIAKPYLTFSYLLDRKGTMLPAE